MQYAGKISLETNEGNYKVCYKCTTTNKYALCIITFFKKAEHKNAQNK